MKRENLVKKAKDIARKVLALVLCIGSVLVITPNESHAAASYQGYLWYHMKTQSDFTSFAHGGLNRSDRSIKTGEEYDPGKIDDSKGYPDVSSLPQGRETDWYRIMLIYPDNQYFVSGNSSCNDNKSFLGQRIKAAYGIDIDKEQFVTTSGLNTPYVKYEGKDNENNCNRYYVRFSDADQLGKTYWTMYTKWYGCSHASAAKCDFKRPGRTIDEWKDDANWWSYQSFKWVDGRARIFYNIDGAYDRCWDCQSGGEIECTQDMSGSKFLVYVGIQYPLSTLSSSFSIPAGTTASWNNYVIKEGVTVTVREKATLILDDGCYNNGIIHVSRGGSLIIRGIVDMNEPEDGKAYQLKSGKIEMDPGSRLLVEDSGTLLMRNTSSSSYCYFNDCLVDIQGVAVFPQGFAMDDADFRVGYGGAVCIGVVPAGDKGHSNYNRGWLLSHKDTCLSTLCSNNAIDKKEPLIATGYSSIQSNGIFYMNPDFGFYVEYIEGSNNNKKAPTDGTNTKYGYFSFKRSTNINASVKNMMPKW